MNKLNLSLWLEDSVDLSKTDLGKTLEISFNNEVWEFDLNSIAVDTNFDSYRSEFLFGRSSLQPIQKSTYNIDASVRNKSKKILKEAKEEVRKKQAEFKEAQRKLSELMDNKI